MPSSTKTITTPPAVGRDDVRARQIRHVAARCRLAPAVAEVIASLAFGSQEARV